MDGQPDSDDLFRRAQAGDDRARDDLCAHAFHWLCRWGHGRLPRWARERFSTGDLAQMTVLKFLEVLHDFTPSTEDALRKFLAVVFTNALRDEIRRAKRRGLHAAQDDLLGQPDTRPGPLEEVLSKLAVERVLRSFQHLRPVDQELISEWINEASYAQIAAQKGFGTADAARAAVNRALNKLRRLVGSQSIA